MTFLHTNSFDCATEIKLFCLIILCTLLFLQKSVLFRPEVFPSYPARQPNSIARLFEEPNQDHLRGKVSRWRCWRHSVLWRGKGELVSVWYHALCWGQVSGKFGGSAVSVNVQSNLVKLVKDTIKKVTSYIVEFCPNFLTTSNQRKKVCIVIFMKSRYVAPWQFTFSCHINAYLFDANY